MCVQLHNLHQLYNNFNTPYQGFEFAYVTSIKHCISLFHFKETNFDYAISI